MKGCLYLYLLSVRVSCKHAEAVSREEDMESKSSVITPVASIEFASDSVSFGWQIE